MDQPPVVTSIGSLDLDRYCGLWYEIGRLPLRWEDADAADITANYTLEDDGSVRVDNRCIDKSGAPSQAIGRATPVNGRPGQFHVWPASRASTPPPKRPTWAKRPGRGSISNSGSPRSSRVGVLPTTS